MLSEQIMLIYPIEFATPEYDEAVGLRYRVLRKPLGLEFTTECISEIGKRVSGEVKWQD